MKKRILYAEANYAAMVRNNGYFVDKTEYIARLEMVNNPVFLRPRRFGKSLLCTTLEYYYSLLYKDQFEELFGQTWIGRNPTHLHNSFFVLHLDFSTVETDEMGVMEKNFNHKVNLKLEALLKNHEKLFAGKIIINNLESASNNLQVLMDYLLPNNLPPLYIIIDEYDNFANQLITGNKDHLYKKLMKDEGFLKTFFKVIKEGRKTGAIHNVFITGVLLAQKGTMVETFQICLAMSSEKDFSPQALRNLVWRLRSKISKQTLISSRDLGYMLQ